MIYQKMALPNNNDANERQLGLTKREWFAGQVMIAYMNIFANVSQSPNVPIKDTVKNVIQLTDALMAELEKESNEEKKD